MLIGVTIVAIGIFVAGVIRRLKMDTEQERTFRTQLSGGVRLDDHTPLLS
ncbi:MAG: hypothetical protein ACXW3L_00760 [Limisphaerales bacterium]